MTAERVNVSQLDFVKGEIGYLKVWLGIVVVTGVSTSGWLISDVDKVNEFLLSGTLALVVCLAVLAFAIHGRIAHHIQSLKNL